MLNEKLIEILSKFTKISEKKLEEYLSSNDLTTLFEHPETIRPTQNQLENLKNLTKLGNFYNRVSNYQDYKFEKTTDMVDYLDSQFFSKFDKEYFITAFLDDENKLLGTETISIGTVNASIVHPRDVFKQALQYNAKKLVLSHNHPSGSPQPSKEDLRITARLETVAQMFNMQVVDHIIVGKNDYYSFKKEGHIFIDLSTKDTQNKSHELLYKKDVNKFSDLLSKVTKIPKTELNNALNKTSVKDLVQHPEAYLNKENHINSINMIKDIALRYDNASYISNERISSPDDMKDYVNNKYGSFDKINVALFLDTKNKVTNSIIVPENLSEKNRFKFIMENAILHDSNSYALVVKDSSLPSTTSYDRINKVQDMYKKSEAVGIPLLDHIDIKALDSVSYKAMNFFDEQASYKTTPVQNQKVSMEERFKNAVAEAEKRNNNQNKENLSKKQEQDL